MDKITKALKKFSDREKKVVKNILSLIKKGEFTNLNLKKLKGNNYIFRVRKGKIRVILYTKDKKIRILNISRRTNNTYKNFNK